MTVYRPREDTGFEAALRLDRNNRLPLPEARQLRERLIDATSNGQVWLTLCRQLFDNDIEQRNAAAIAATNEIVTRAERANEAARERFEEEDKRLLTAQILMNGAMQKMALAMEETTGKLDALINTVDGIILSRLRPRPKDPS